MAEHVGAVGVGFGLHAAAAVYVAGPVLVVRDWVQRLAGFRASLLTVAVATAPAVSFAVSEVLDAIVDTIVVRRRSVAVGVLSTGIVGRVTVSLLFPAIVQLLLRLARSTLTTNRGWSV
ncbi:hypothetical protein ACIOD2_47455 [Amycolatopsis sp. NPDC088138]|uniref:hypothetical protein n=1 Tax=Amycolatopsis sp. NPDC088138 TaxID=3363938 RepID=UPI00381966A5